MLEFAINPEPGNPNHQRLHDLLDATVEHSIEVLEDLLEASVENPEDRQTLMLSIVQQTQTNEAMFDVVVPPLMAAACEMPDMAFLPRESN